MTKYIALMLAFMFVIIGSDYVGQHGWTIWLGIPLTIIYIAMLVMLIRAFIQDAKRR